MSVKTTTDIHYRIESVLKRALRRSDVYIQWQKGSEAIGGATPICQLTYALHNLLVSEGLMNNALIEEAAPTPSFKQDLVNTYAALLEEPNGIELVQRVTARALAKRTET